VSVAAPAGVERVRVRVEGAVQGVGFRPYVFRLARGLSLGGFVLNDERGVLLEIEGPPARIERFIERLPLEAPPLAAVERLAVEPVPVESGVAFEIRSSRRRGEPGAFVSPDTAPCPECLAELFDPAERRHRYPFVNCTNCGPRFTIVRGVPYDRPLTTMASFQMCARCRAEYEDPLDRRFHAQPIACAGCGPALTLVDPSGRPVRTAEARDAAEAAAKALLSGLIVAVKGVGGFHLACRADGEQPVAALRARKHREEKPFALMVADCAAAGRLAHVGPVERELLLGRERPIVLARRRPDPGLAAAVAPSSPDLGLMLPCSPLHHLLLADTGVPLVMTSGNVSDEPIAYEDADALARLGRIADLFLLHDRPIETRTDDSVVRAVSLRGRRRPLMLRRSRGYVPEQIELPVPADRHLLACGAELKSTFCLAKGHRAWVGHHIGDLANYETLRSFQQGIERFELLFAIEPVVVAHDLHPEYLSSKHALEREADQHVGVQHHHAHLAACLAEHGETGPAVGAVYDGTGFGTDGTVWGGELLAGDLAGFERAGHLWPVRMPGGEQAIREPWRMACAWVTEAAGAGAAVPPTLAPRVDSARWDQVAGLTAADSPFAPVTTSVGRLFDAVSALCGLRTHVTYEGQAAFELEATADLGEAGAYPLPAGASRLDARETILSVLEDVGRGVPAAAISARFHNGLAHATAAACADAAGRHGTETVVLSGGVFQNRLLLERTAALITGAGLRLLVPERLPPNDGGISFGQAAVAAARLARGAR
jgi:hydrogenase maturation protein HypF